LIIQTLTTQALSNKDCTTNIMEHDGTSKAPKDKHCPYCGQSFTSSSLGRHLDLYIKNKNPKAPDGLHNVEEIRKLRSSITRRQPRGGVRRDSSAPRDSQAGSKRSYGTSDGDSTIGKSPGTLPKYIIVAASTNLGCLLQLCHR